MSGGDEIGELRLEVTTDVDGVSELPHLVGHTHTIQLPLAEGCANVQVSGWLQLHCLIG